MKNERYSIELHFDPKNRTTLHKVYNCLAKLDHASSHRLGELLAKGRLTVKRNADLTTTRRLVSILNETGATCRCHRESAPSPTGVHAASKSTGEPPFSNDEDPAPAVFICPQCGHPQPQAKECSACGIIIAKAKPRPQPETKSPSASSSDQQASGTTALWASLDSLRRQTIPTLWGWLKGWPLYRVDIRRRVQQLNEALFRCGVVFALAMILELGLLFLGKALWYFYTWTPVGQYYVEHFSDEADAIIWLTQMNPLLLVGQVTLTAFICGLMVAAAAQFCHLIRYFFEPAGIFGKLLLWFLPTAALVAWIVSRQEPWPQFAIAFGLAVGPILCLLSSCLHLAKVVLPELGDIIGLIAKAAGGKRGLKDKLIGWFERGQQSK